MNKLRGLAELFLLAKILEYYEYTGNERKSRGESKPYGEITIKLENKNVAPKLPESYQDGKDA